jgi:hypothetical protein
MRGRLKASLPLLFPVRESHRQLRRRLLWLVVLLLIADAGAIVLVHRFDHVGWEHAVEWTTSELVTAGSSQTAKGSFGRAAEVVLGFCAVTVVAAVAGALGAYFHRRGLELAPLEDGRESRARNHAP